MADGGKVKAWREFLEKNIVLSPPYDRLQKTVESNYPFCITLKNIDGLLPKEGQTKPEFCLAVSLFDVTYKQFFGRTWLGPVITTKAGAGKKVKLTYNQNIYFHTTLNDLSIVAVIEVINITHDDKGNETRKSCGWGMFRVFKYEGDMVDTSSNQAPPVQKMDIYHGSPRALLYMEDPIESNEFLQTIKGCQISYTIRTHKYLQKIMHLVPENVIIGTNDIVPGIAEGQKDPNNPNAIDNLKKPRLLKTISNCFVDKVNIMLYPNVEKFEEEVCSLLNEDRINRENRVADGTTVKVVERRLQVGVHNGWGYVQEPQMVYLQTEVPLQKKGSFKRGHQRTQSAGSLGSHGLALVLRNRVPLDGMVEDPMYAIVFVLEYVLSEPVSADDRKLSHSIAKSQTVTVAVRWAAWSPFSSDGQHDVTISLIGGPSSSPNDSFVYKSPVTTMQDDTTAKLAPGSISFQFQIHKKHREDGSRAGSQASLRSPSSMMVRSPSMQSMTEDMSMMQPLPTAGLPGRPPLPGRTPGKSHPGPVSLAVPQYGMNQMYSQAVPGIMTQPPELMPTQALGMAYQQPMMPMMYSSPQPSYQMDITHVREPTTSRPGMDAPELQELPFTPVHAPILATAPHTHSGQGLSRAAYARLYTAGFPPILDRHGEAPDVVDPADHVTFVPAKEESDSLQCNEITLQFLAFARMDNLNGQTKSKGKSKGNIFFTFQFYRFPQVTSERLHLGAVEGDLSQDKANQPCVLQKLAQDGSVLKGPPGYQMKYFVDPSFLKPGEARLFGQHLAMQTLHIDVWDGDSLLLVGSCAVELKHLCRQGREGVQVTYELDVITTEYSEDTPTMTGDITRGGSVRPVGVNTVLKGRLHLRLANCGYPVDTKNKTEGAIPSTMMGRSYLVVAEKSTSSNFLGGSLNAGLAQSHNSGLKRSKVYKAAHVAETNRELASVLVTRRDPMAAVNETQDMDAVKKRKLARMQALRAATGAENQQQPFMSYKTMKQERTRDLKTIEMYRSQTKKDGILNMLNSAITTEHRIHPSMGTAEFFEYVLKNPYNVEHTITIHWEDPGLSIITDAREWRHFKSLNQVHTPVEEGMFNTQTTSQHPQIFLRAKETVNVPFKYLSFKANQKVAPQGPVDPFRPHIRPPSDNTDDSLDSRIVKVFFDTENGKPISILSLQVEPVPHVVDQTFRFHHPEQSFLKKSIRLPPFKVLPGAPVGDGGYVQLFCRCSDANVICETRPVQQGEPQDVFLKVACGASPQIKNFFVAIYMDPFLSKPVQIWQFYVHSLQRVDVSSVEGQTSRFALILRGTQASRLVQCFSSHPTEMQIQPSDSFMLAANAVHEINVGVRPHQVGSKFMYINVVDVEYHQLIRTWLVCLSCKSPVVTKAFELQLPVGGGKGCNKRISYSNPYPHQKVFNVRTNRPDLLQFKETRLVIGPGASHVIGLRFAPAQSTGMIEILIFINDEDDKNEETFCVKAIYTMM